MRVFQKVIDEGGFATAARALDMSPAVVTRLVADLETHLGTRLLHRTTRRLSLSAAGENYLGRVRVILQDIDEADQAVSAQPRELTGVLRVLATPVLATHVLAPLIAGFRKLHPKVVLHIDVASYQEPPIEEYDLSLLPSKEGLASDVTTHSVSSTAAILVCSPSYLKNRGAPQLPDDLKQHAILHLQWVDANVQSPAWRLLNSDKDDEAVDVIVEPVLFANHSETLLRATLDGAGISSASLELVAPYLMRGELVRVLRPWITGRFNVLAALPSRPFLPERSHVFLDYLVAQTGANVKTAIAARDAY
jgi:DNA-binding transcriptional LysR family regulator